MKNYTAFLSLVLLIIVAGCKEGNDPDHANEQKLISLTAGEVFEHKLKGCEVDTSFENTCSDWFLIMENSELDYLIGGGDVIYRGSWEIKQDTLFVHTSSLDDGMLKLVALDQDTLEEVESGNLWYRSDL